jgi:arylsulfatase A-like enzyme
MKPTTKRTIPCLLHILLGWTLPGPGYVAAAEQAKPNIILILADDLGYETIGANGGTSYRTPRIDKLARDGLRFEHCYAQPLCTPSRVQLMTGRYNSRNYIDFGYPILLPHAPIWPTPASAEWRDPAKRRPGDSKKGQTKYYGDTISYLDGLVGRVIDKVDELKLGDRTLILFTGDNGTDKAIASMCNGRKVKGGESHTHRRRHACPAHRALDRSDACRQNIERPRGFHRFPADAA